MNSFELKKYIILISQNNCRLFDNIYTLIKLRFFYYHTCLENTKLDKRTKGNYMYITLTNLKDYGLLIRHFETLAAAVVAATHYSYILLN